MKVLVACEESQAVCTAFRELGYEAYSCDVVDCSGGHPEWHIKGDVLPYINGHCSFTTGGGQQVVINDKWDLLIAHPPCTYLCMSGQQWCNVEKYGQAAIERQKNREEAVKFFMNFINADCDHIAVENPVGIMTRRYKKATQYIHPYQFGHPCGKRTGLWLKGLPKLKPTNIVEVEYITSKSGRRWEKWFYESSKIRNHAERSKFRSKTFKGVAEAMAKQWSDYLERNNINET